MNKLEWYGAIILSSHISGMTNTTVSLSGVDTFLNNDNNESNNMYFSTITSTFLMTALELGNLF